MSSGSVSEALSTTNGSEVLARMDDWKAEDDHEGCRENLLRLGVCEPGLVSCPSFSISCPKSDHW